MIKVTQEELEFDIKNTDNECKAYRLILEGLYLLEKIPEVDHGRINIEISKYETLLEGNEEYLAQLIDVHQQNYADTEEIEIHE
jgi:hypothetical protein